MAVGGLEGMMVVGGLEGVLAVEDQSRLLAGVASFPSSISILPPLDPPAPSPPSSVRVAVPTPSSCAPSWVGLEGQAVTCGHKVRQEYSVSYDA